METFHKRLDKVSAEVIEMGEHAMTMLNQAMEALINLDDELAENVHAEKDRLLEYDVEIEREVLQILGLYQPVASDLRRISCILKTIAHLYRIGRYGKDIANIVRKELKGRSHIKKIVSLPQMNRIVIAMISDVLEAFKSNSKENLDEFENRDDEVDELRISIYRECITYMLEDQRNIPICMAYTMIARYLERCGDHACNIAEKVHYMVTGERVEIK